MIKALINGEEIEQLSIEDRGFQYGDGLFETIAIRDGRYEYLDRHLMRMKKGCERLGLIWPGDMAWLDDIHSLGKQANGVLKLVLSRGVGGRGYVYDTEAKATRISLLYSLPEFDSHNISGVNVRVCATPVSINPVLAGIKHLNRLDNVLARNESRDPAIAEGIMLDDQQHVIEGTMSNLFCVLDGELFTPSLARAGIQGITRNRIIELAELQGIQVHEIDISLGNFLDMEAIFMCNSLIGIWPVIRVMHGDQEYSFSDISMARQLQQALQSDLSQQKEL